MTTDLTAWLNGLDATRAAAVELPWHIDSQDDHRVAAVDGGGVTNTYLPEDAALIVAAVNALPTLTAALRNVLDLADSMGSEAAERRRVAGATPCCEAADRIHAAVTAAVEGADQ